MENASHGTPLGRRRLARARPLPRRRRRVPDGQYLAGRLLLDAGEARRAIVLWEAAADQGLGAAAAALGAIHDRGEGVPRSLARAAIWYTEAENHGDEIAAERLEELRAETRDIFKGMRFV